MAALFATLPATTDVRGPSFYICVWYTESFRSYKSMKLFVSFIYKITYVAGDRDERKGI